MKNIQQKLALIGAVGMLAHKVSERAETADYSVAPYDLPDFDLTDRDQVLREMKKLCPDVIINCAAFTNVDACEDQEELATRVNGSGPGYLAEAAKEVGAILVHISTDYVFDGRKQSPYLETDPIGPISAYGRSKLVGEQTIFASGLERHFILRTSWLYGPGGKNFVETIIRLAQEREELRIVADQIGTPTYTGDLATAIFKLLKMRNHASQITEQGLDGTPHSSLLTPYGLYHFSNSGQCSWYEFACAIVTQVKKQGEPLKVKKIVPIRTEEYPLPAPRPAWSVFSKDKYLTATGASIHDWQASLKRYLQERNP